MLYYEHKSYLHLHKSKCELAQVYQKANDTATLYLPLHKKNVEDQRFLKLLPKRTREKKQEHLLGEGAKKKVKHVTVGADSPSPLPPSEGGKEMFEKGLTPLLVFGLFVSSVTLRVVIKKMIFLVVFYY